MTDRAKRNEIFSSSDNVTPEKAIQKQDVTKDEFGWEVPVSAVPVPSQGKVYPVNTALHGVDTLDIKAMTAHEEDILTSRALIKKGMVISYLIKSCLIDKTIDVDNLLVGDRNALMISIRITGYGSEYGAKVTCPECDNGSSQKFNLTDLEIKRLDIDPISSGENIFSFELPVTKKVVNFRFLTGKDEKEMTTTLDRRKKMFPDQQLDSVVTSQLENVIISIDGVTDKNKIRAFIKNMPAFDSRRLRDYIDNNEPGIDMNVWMDCPNCDATSRVSLPIGPQFFWPGA